MDDLYANLDAYIASQERQLAESQASDTQMSSMDTDAFIREFLADSSVTESTADTAPVPIPEMSAPAAILAEAPAEAEESVRNVVIDVKPALDSVLQDTTVAAAEYEVEEPATEGRRTEVRYHHRDSRARSKALAGTG